MGYSKPAIGESDWIIDSGASRHLTTRRELLEDYINRLPTSIMIGNGKDINAIGQGNITLQTISGMISLSGVLYVPDIGSNLLSVASIVDQGFHVEFTRTGCSVNKRNTESVIGRRQGNIYFVAGLQEIAFAGLTDRKDATTKGNLA